MTGNAKPVPVPVPVARGLCAQASALARDGKLATALPIFGEALRQAPSDPAVLVQVGHALAAAGETERASELATTAAQLAPTAAAPWLLLGLLAHGAGRFDRALECFTLGDERIADDGSNDDGVHRIDGDDVDLRARLKVARARTLVAIGAAVEAAAVVADVEESTDVLLIRAEAAAVTGDAEQSRRLVLAAAESDPDHPEPYKRLAAIMAGSDRSLARELVAHALRLAPHDVEAKALAQALAT